VPKEIEEQYWQDENSCNTTEDVEGGKSERYKHQDSSEDVKNSERQETRPDVGGNKGQNIESQ